MVSSAVNFALLQNQQKLPVEFMWPENDVKPSEDDIDVPIIDLRGFIEGDEDMKQRIAAAVRDACIDHGAFQVINHGFDSNLTESILEMAAWFFELPMAVKMKAEKAPGTTPGYSAAPTERFSNLLWSETLSFLFTYGPTPVVEEFFRSKQIGPEFEDMGKMYQKYCESMKRLSQEVMELMGTSLGLKDRRYYRELFEDGYAFLRCNYYPPCQHPDRTLGIGPHYDPPAYNILLQDGVSGLEVFSHGVWRTLRPYPGAFVINVGDLFVALSNGKYKSCFHRGVVNKEKARKSIVFIVCPRDDKLMVPPEELIMSEDKEEEGGGRRRRYPEFTWSEYHKYLRGKSRAEGSSLEDFVAGIEASAKTRPCGE